MKDIITYINENNDDINWANVKDVIETFEDYGWEEIQNYVIVIMNFMEHQIDLVQISFFMKW